jgi:threonine synthase
LELFHGPTSAFKDVALQLLGNLFEYFLVRRNKGKTGTGRHHLTVIDATSGDIGSAAIYGLRGKKDVSVFILHPKRRVSPVQEAQVTTVLDANVHNLAVEGTFDDCQVSLSLAIISYQLRVPGYCQSPLRRPSNQLHIESSCCQFHQLGASCLLHSRQKSFF